MTHLSREGALLSALDTLASSPRLHGLPRFIRIEDI